MAPRRPICGTQPTFPTLREPDLGRGESYLHFQGERWAYPLWQQLLHQVNHATQHRSEAALLTRLGYSPGWLDLLVYVDEQRPRSAPSHPIVTPAPEPQEEEAA